MGVAVMVNRGELAIATILPAGRQRITTGPFAMSAVVFPSRLMAFGSAPLATRYKIISTSPRAAALCIAVLPS